MNFKEFKEKFYGKAFSEEIPPIVTSYHPRVGVSQNNVVAAFLSNELAADNKPLLLAYTWDYLKKWGVKKSRSPLVLHMENEYIFFRSYREVENRPLPHIPTTNYEEVEKFFKTIANIIDLRIHEFKNSLNEYLFVFGHPFFWFKKVDWTPIRRNIELFSSTYKKIIPFTKNLGEYITRINEELLSIINLKLTAIPLDELMSLHSEAWLTLFKYLKEVDFQKSYGKPLFRVLDENFRKTTLNLNETSLHNFENLLYEKRVIPSLLPILTFLSLKGVKVIVEGSPTEKWYPEEIQLANKISKKLGYGGELNYLGFGRFRILDMRELTDFCATFDLLAKVAGKCIYRNMEFKLIEDTLEDLLYRGDGGCIPQQYKNFLSILSDKEKSKTSLEKYKENRSTSERILTTISYRQKVLGGIVQDKSIEGILVKSSRWPTLLECLLYDVDIPSQLESARERLNNLQVLSINENSFQLATPTEILPPSDIKFKNWISLTSYLLAPRYAPGVIKDILKDIYGGKF